MIVVRKRNLVYFYVWYYNIKLFIISLRYIDVINIFYSNELYYLYFQESF